MKIKLAVLDKDQSYLNRMTNVFGTKYADKFQIYSFTDMEVAISMIGEVKIDVLLASDTFEVNVSELPARCGFAYFIEAADVETLNGYRAICKFQRADMIYKQILSIYSETAGNVSGLRFGEEHSKVILFQPISGGVGASSMAASCAIHFASKGKKTLYLNLEHFGSANVFFNADGQFDMSDIIYAVKSKKTNLPMKLESCVKQAENGVYFYSQPKIALDMIELNYEDIARLLSELQRMGSYDYIIVDADFTIDRETLKVYGRAHAIVWVCDGSEISNVKLFRALNALNMIEQNDNLSVTGRLALLYNKFSSKTSRMLSDIGIRNIGGAPRYEHATTAQIIQQLSAKDMFEVIM